MAKDMKVKDYVAQIGETKYKTLSEAIENVNGDNNQTKIKKLILMTGFDKLFDYNVIL